MDYAVGTTADSRMQGCGREAQRADITSDYLEGLRDAVRVDKRGFMDLVITKIRYTGQLLRELADQAQLHVARVGMIVNYLDVVLPCLCQTLRCIDVYYHDSSISREMRWRRMCHQMSQEAGGMTLPERFDLYMQFLAQLASLLVRSPQFDLNALEHLKQRILDLRQRRGIEPPPIHTRAMIPYEGGVGLFQQDNDAHWAEFIFTVPLPSYTRLGGSERSESKGPHWPMGNASQAPAHKVLFKRPFDNEISVTAYQHASDLNPWLLTRVVREDGQMFYTTQGVHTLCVDKVGNSLVLKRWSYSAHRSKVWTSLRFQSWEELVLFHCTFMSLKAHNTLTNLIDEKEYSIAGEKRLFQAKIADDGFQHSLIVYEDRDTGMKRLHAAVWEGELRQCPVWTAFVPDPRTRPATWVEQRRHRTVHLHDLHVYVFNPVYRQANMRHRRSHAFILTFVKEVGAQEFLKLFHARRRRDREGSPASSDGEQQEPAPRAATPRARTPRPATPRARTPRPRTPAGGGGRA